MGAARKEVAWIMTCLLYHGQPKLRGTKTSNVAGEEERIFYLFLRGDVWRQNLDIHRRPELTDNPQLQCRADSKQSMETHDSKLNDRTGRLQPCCKKELGAFRAQIDLFDYFLSNSVESLDVQTARESLLASDA